MIDQSVVFTVLPVVVLFLIIIMLFGSNGDGGSPA